MMEEKVLYYTMTSKYRDTISHSLQSLFDGSLSGSLVFSYNAKAVDGQLVLEASPVEGISLFAHSPHATMLEVHLSHAYLHEYY